MSDAIITRLGEALAAAASDRDAVALIIYAPFGIVRGEVTPVQLQLAAHPTGAGREMIEIQRATVEHYSNHLPTGNYASLFISLDQISGFVILKE
jgi:hypothetical protein